MRIAFVGKGGSGKTTLASLFIRHLAGQSAPVLAIDADLNQHLGPALKFSSPPSRFLGHEARTLKQHLIHENSTLSVATTIKTTPPGTGSRLFFSIKDITQQLPDFVITQGTVTWLPIGPQTAEDVGVRCYHSKTGAVELLLNHFVDSTKEYIVVDMTAGADAFASGLYDKFDLTIIAVEPTQKSLEVFSQYAAQAKSLGTAIKAVGNKVLDESDRAFLAERLGEDLLGFISFSAAIRASERDRETPAPNLEPENQAVLHLIQSALDATKKDWPRYLARSIDIHKKNAESWGNQQTGTDLTSTIDSTFSYPTSS